MTINLHALRAIGANETILEWLASGIKFDFINEPPQIKLLTNNLQTLKLSF